MVDNLQLREPVPEDGPAVFALIEQCPPLDTNSIYCNLLQCSHFSETSVAADLHGELAGFVSGYKVPAQANTLFVWQVAVSQKMRGKGLATQMIEHMLARSSCKDITYIETTITESNPASWSLFEGLARRLGTHLNRSVLFDCDQHFNGQHDSEILARIGPFKFNAS